MRLKNNKDKINSSIVTGKHFVQSKIGINTANAFIENNEVTKSKQLEGYPICVDGNYSFEDTYSRKRKLQHPRRLSRKRRLNRNNAL